MVTAALRVRDYMTTDLVTVGGDLEIMQAVRLLIDRDISGVPVLGDQGELVGVLTERDCIRVALHAGYHDERGGPVMRFMSHPVRTVHPEDSLLAAAEIFAESSIRRCPVVEEDRLVGLLSRRDVLRALSESNWFAAP